MADNPAEYPDFDDVISGLRVGMINTPIQEKIAAAGARVFKMDFLTFAEKWDSVLLKIQAELNNMHDKAQSRISKSDKKDPPQLDDLKEATRLARGGSFTAGDFP